tara:strand:+ start:392 stop:571 length:180 start_codon:yes stop_codon:yes gene_type:complete
MNTKPFFMVVRPSRIHAGFCLLWCGEDIDESPYPKAARFNSRDEAVETYPDWEEEIMTS